MHDFVLKFDTYWINLEFLLFRFIPSSDGEVSSSSDEEEKLVKLRQRNEAKRYHNERIPTPNPFFIFY